MGSGEPIFMDAAPMFASVLEKVGNVFFKCFFFCRMDTRGCEEVREEDGISHWEHTNRARRELNYQHGGFGTR